VAPKSLPPPEQQLENESLQLWGKVTEAILAKQYSKATSLKVELEEQQREKARERERTKATWKPVFFEQVTGNAGKPQLTEIGNRVLQMAQRAEWDLGGVKNSLELGAPKKTPNGKQEVVAS
jgi:oxysterol-binding protein-related protein 9/10/11